MTHTRIRPHTPTENAEIKRYHRTIGEQIEERKLQDFARARAVIPHPSGPEVRIAGADSTGPRCVRDHRGLQANPAALGVIVLAAAGLLSR